MKLGHGCLVGGPQPGRDAAARVERRAVGKTAGRANFEAVDPEEGTVDVLHVAQHVLGLGSVGEEVENPSVTQELVDVVEMPATAPVDRPGAVGGELLCQRVDQDELFEEGAPGVEDGDVERFQVVELPEVGPGGFDVSPRSELIGTSSWGWVPPRTPISRSTRTS